MLSKQPEMRLPSSVERPKPGEGGAAFGEAQPFPVEASRTKPAGLDSQQLEAAPCQRTGLSTEQITFLAVGLALAVAIVIAAVILAKHL